MTKNISYRQRIEEKLTAALTPTLLKIHDDSARHAGHAGHDARGETHFNVTVVSPVFEGKTRIERHRMVYGLLAEEMQGRVHALALELFAPSENNL